MPAVILPAQPYTVLLATNACELTRENQDKTFATDVFMYDFESCKDISNEHPAEIFKTFSGLTATQGQIRLTPEKNNNIKEFTQWVKYQFRLCMDPTKLPFPQDDTAELLRRFKTHKMFVYKSYTISKATKPEILREQVKWEYWEPTFMNYVMEIPGRDGVPLKYIIRDNYFAKLTPNKDFLDNYVDDAILQGESFTIYAAEVHTFIVKLIARNEESE